MTYTNKSLFRTIQEKTSELQTSQGPERERGRRRQMRNRQKNRTINVRGAEQRKTKSQLQQRSKTKGSPVQNKRYNN